MPSDFIDRAALEAKMHAEFPRLPVGTHGADVMERDGFREGFMAGVDAVLALLDAETTEEWGTWSQRFREFLPFSESRERAERHAAEAGEKIGVRRIARTPWLPSEGGER